MYICRRAPRRHEFLPSRGMTLGETPTVDSTYRWGQIPNTAAHDDRSPNAAAHGGRALAPWPTASAMAYIRGASP
jgi:hypothetical protein